MKTFTSTSKRVAATPRSKRLRNQISITATPSKVATESTDNRIGSLLNTLSSLLVPVNDAGEELSLLSASEAVALKAKVSLFSLGELSAKGNGGDGSAAEGGGVDEDQLAALLEEWGYATQEWVGGRGYLTQAQTDLLYQPKGNYLTDVTKPMIESVLTGNIASHTHSQYLTAHQSLANYVTLDTTQTISGLKTFTGNIISSGTMYFKNPARENGIYIKGSSEYDNITFARHQNYTWQKTIGTLDINGNMTMASFIKTGGTASQFLKADGSVDSNTYLTTGTAASTYVKKSGDTMTGGLTIKALNYGDQLEIFRTDALANSVIKFTNSEKVLGYIGICGSTGAFPYDTAFRKDGTDYRIWHSGNDGAGSGLDADMLDGLESTGFIRNQGASSTASAYVNADDVWQNAVKHDYRWTNAPSSTIASVLDLTYSKDWRSQIFILHQKKTYIGVRSRYDGTTWGAWRQIAFTDSNVASATNADLLNGLHADDIRRRSLGFERIAGQSVSGGYDLNTMLQGGGMASQYASTSYWANAPVGMSYGTALCLKGHNYEALMGMMAWDINHKEASGNLTRNLWWRSYARKADDTLGWGQWRQIAFVDSNVASASKLANDSTFTAWGKTFFSNGVPQSVSGDMSGVGHIKMSSYLFMNSGAVAKGAYLRADDAGGLRICSHNNYVWTATNFGFTYDGKMGIGTVEPAYPLDVNGTARIRQRLYVPSGLDLGGPVINHDGINLNIDRDAHTDMIYLGSDVKVLTASGDLIVKSIRIGQVVLSWDAAKGALKIAGTAYATGELAAKG